MSISSSLNAGVTGLAASSTRLSTISDNIANSSTSGYKRSLTEFSSMVLEQTTSAYAAGGVQVNTYKDVAATGSLSATGNATDIAIAGRGLLPVTTLGGLDDLPTQRELLLTPTGSFTPNENGYLRTQSGLYLLGWPADAVGDVGAVSRNSGANLEPVNISASEFSASPTSRIELGINLPADASVAGATPAVYDVPVQYFDNLGREQTLNVEFTPVIPATGASNQWTVQFYDQAGDPLTSLGQLTVTFDDSSTGGGSILSVASSGGVSYDSATGEVSMTLSHGDVDVFIGTPGDNAGITQLAGEFAPSQISKDGAPIGDLQSVEIDENGFVVAIYDTGFQRTLYQIPVADVPNMNGLKAESAQSFSLSADSGNLYFWDAGTGPIANISGYSLMESTTDIAEELTDLIETQRAYSSNAKIVQTVDEMLEETTNLKR